MGIYVHDPSITRLLHLEPSSVTNGHEGMAAPHSSKKHQLTPNPWVYHCRIIGWGSLWEPANYDGWGDFSVLRHKS